MSCFTIEILQQRKVFEVENYIDPEMKIINFEVEDIITTSGGNWNPGGGVGWEEEEEPW